MDPTEVVSNAPTSEDIDLQLRSISTDEDAMLGAPTSTALATVVPAADSVAVMRTPLRMHENPFPPLSATELPQDSDGNCDASLTSNVRILPTAAHGQKRSRGTLSSLNAGSASRPKPFVRHGGTRIGRGQQPNVVRRGPNCHDETADYNSYDWDSDSADPLDQNEEKWQAVTYQRHKPARSQPGLVEECRATGGCTVILKPQDPCRIVEEKFILHDAAVSKHVKVSSTTPEWKGDPRILIRYLDRINQIVVDTDDCGVRDALLTITQLPLSRKPTQFQAYEAITRNQMRGIIHNTGGMTATELKENLHWRKCEIISARPIGEKFTAPVTFQGRSLPFKIGLKSFTIRVFHFKPTVYACQTSHKLGHGKEQCPNVDKPRCQKCRGKQLDSSGECPNNTPKCRNCGCSHLATARNCPKRVEINKKLTTRKSPADVKRNQRSGPKTDQGPPTFVIT
ncbi:hypothetical protein HPB48_021817 [Haemaphysalis longicornis]|uniref:Uncharacterized protein n=1 Tax=Haemaphysalis longicornis TaxID=44386 RepID=A0A9J6FMX5_HAELO|nr:hypothetical protein HPB48_021817 [Haemaphysalis longicornis]